MLVAFVSSHGPSRADTRPATVNATAVTISIDSDGPLYSIAAQQATLPDVLRELGKAAGFEVKIFEPFDSIRQHWRFDSVSLPRLLDNLLRGYSTVMLYGEPEAADHTAANSNPALRELWLLARAEAVEPDPDALVNISIQLDPTEAQAAGQKVLTPEQEYEIGYIDNLEGMTGDDVIGILQQTLLTDKDPLVRKRAVSALGDIGGTRVLDALESGMGDSSAVVRTELADTFGSIRDQRSMLLLGQILMGDASAGPRRQAVLSLYQQNTVAAHTFIEAALKDRDGGVRKAADEILQQWQLTLDDYLTE